MESPKKKASAQGTAISPSKRQQMDGLWTQMEGCEESDAIRRTEMAQQVQAQMQPLTSQEQEHTREGSPRKDIEILKQYVGDVMTDVWPGEEIVVQEGFTPRAMQTVTNHIREACGEMDENVGGGPVISPGILLLLLAKVEQLLVRRGTKALVEMPTIPGQRLVIVGDLHGQLKDCLWVYYRYGLPSEASGNNFLFNGDIADRGFFSVECFVLTLGWMLAFPNTVYMNRGNHEDLLVNTSRCGGFYDECIQKYKDHGRMVFEAFGRVFATLPLAHIWGKAPARILVVHGGIPRVPSQMLTSLRHMQPRLPTVAMRTQSLEEVVQKDCLWSDPQDGPGHQVSTRGSSLMRFGPDVTLKFCQDEGVGLVVRSHEVPPTGEGYCFQHGDRLCTVFSASNYKGIEHNSGAVLLIKSADLAAGRLVVRPDTYFAPELREACAVVPEAPKELEVTIQTLAQQLRERRRLLDAKAIEGERRSAIEQHDAEGGQLTNEIVQILGGLVIARKEELWQAFWGKDAGLQQGGTTRIGFATKAAWMEICECILGHGVAWEQLGSALDIVEACPPHQDMVDYNRFLHRFHVTLKEAGCVRAVWIDNILSATIEKLEALSVQELLDTFDQDKNGRLTIPELAEAFKSLDAGLTSAQIRALFLTFAVHCDDTEQHEDIEVESFLSALVVAVQESTQKEQSRHARKRSAWPKWASRFLRHLGRDIWEQEEHQLLRQFKACDADSNGLLEPDEFVSIMKALQARSKLPESLALQDEQLVELARLADFDGGGSVSYMEILLALQPEDTALGGHVRFDLFEQICATVWCHKEALLKAFHTLDPDKTNRADASMLTQALQQLNTTLARGSEQRRPLKDFQIEALVSHIALDKSGTVDYHAFLDAFCLEDSVP